jgi:hypothetical protein
MRRCGRVETLRRLIQRIAGKRAPTENRIPLQERANLIVPTQSMGTIILKASQAGAP